MSDEKYEIIRPKNTINTIKENFENLRIKDPEDKENEFAIAYEAIVNLISSNVLIKYVLVISLVLFSIFLYFLNNDPLAGIIIDTVPSTSDGTV